ncbi:MAG: DUF488 domain-containing protein [Deltaproteobacteria bacterium]|nr:DUF488 domain-containing protein [Deltaproteobacteria bacterium]
MNVDSHREDPVTIFTIGHSNHELPHFLDLLLAHHIRVLVDTRSSPWVQYSTHFNAEPLRRAALAAGVRYVYRGDELGGRPASRDFYDDDGRVRYDLIAKTDGFANALDEVVALARHEPTAIMCSEENPADCHRRLLIGRVARGRGHEIVHIRGDGARQTEDEFEERLRSEDPRRNQLDLFAGTEKQEWKSTRSVLPKPRPGDSSDGFATPEYDD